MIKSCAAESELETAKLEHILRKDRPRTRDDL